MIVKGFPKGGQRGVKPAMTGVALGFAVIAYLVPGVSSAADRDKMSATIGSMRYLCPAAPAVRQRTHAGFTQCARQFRECAGAAQNYPPPNCTIHAERCMQALNCTYVDQ